MNPLVALWISGNAKLGQNWAASTGQHSDTELQARIEALLQVIRAQKRAMREWGATAGTAALGIDMIVMGMRARLNEARQLVQALADRDARDHAVADDNENMGSVAAIMADEPDLRTSALCLLSTEDLLQRLNDLRMAVSSYVAAQAEVRQRRGASGQSDAGMRRLMERQTQQADAIATLLRRRGVNVG